MDWVTGAVILGSIVGAVITFELYLKREKSPGPHQLEAEIIVLKGTIVQLRNEIEAWKERGTRAFNSRDSAETSLNKMHELFAKMVGSASEVENLKALLLKTEKKP